ncbi:MAG TPA: lysophospholipid acyltransferase family protein [Candidatus Dormibacteraeota bacterium]|nr:lysophospholipid acyltransferase family protein [Candidatus Dormibacteraeota bacterium]
MRTWFFHPGAILTSWFLWLIGPGRVEGLEHAPRTGPYILVSNHCSNLDPPFLGWAVGHRTGRVIHFMAKDEIRGWPLVGWLARQSGVFFIRRGEMDRGAQRVALQLLAAGRALGLHPEGKRSRDGQLRTGRPGAALLAMRAGVPLLPVGIAGTHRIFAGGRRFPRRSRVTIRIGPTFTLPPLTDDRLDRAALHEATDRIMREIAALLPEEQRGKWRVTDP